MKYLTVLIFIIIWPIQSLLGIIRKSISSYFGEFKKAKADGLTIGDGAGIDGDGS